MESEDNGDFDGGGGDVNDDDAYTTSIDTVNIRQQWSGGMATQ